MKNLIAILLLLCCTPAFAQHPRPWFHDEEAERIEQIETMHPFFATRDLCGDDYSRWAIAENERAYDKARERSRSGLLFTVTDYSVSSYGGQVTDVNGYVIQNNGTRRSNARESTRVYQIGRVSGGPVMLYNPYVVPECR